MQIIAPFHAQLRNRCPNNNYGTDEDEDNIEDDIAMTDEEEYDMMGEDEDGSSVISSNDEFEVGLMIDGMKKENEHNMVSYR